MTEQLDPLAEYERKRLLCARMSAFSAYNEEGNADDAKLVLLGRGDHFAAVKAALDAFEVAFLVGYHTAKANTEENR